MQQTKSSRPNTVPGIQEPYILNMIMCLISSEMNVCSNTCKTKLLTIHMYTQNTPISMTSGRGKNKSARHSFATIMLAKPSIMSKYTPHITYTEHT